MSKAFGDNSSVNRQKIIKIQEELLVKITKNNQVLSVETEKFFTSKVMRK